MGRSGLEEAQASQAHYGSGQSDESSEEEREEVKTKLFKRKASGTEYSRYIAYAVHGFWSGDNVHVRQSRDYQNGDWEKPRIGWACGGRDLKTEPDDLVAVAAFAKAVADAVKVATKWSKDDSAKKKGKK
jgi:hypothetical protein